MSLDGESVCVVTRRRIGAISTPDDPHVILPRRFFPRDQLAQILDRQTVLKILKCHCQICYRHATALGKLGTPAEYIDYIVGPPTSSAQEPSSSETCISLFGLFVYIGYPQFIIGFLQQRSHDIVLETDPTVFTYNIATKYWPRFERHHPMESKQLATQFCSLIHQFAVPSMDSGEYSVYGQNTILPFINEKKIRTPNEQWEIMPEGSPGKVYAFEIYERYRKFPHFPNVKKYARKELEGTPPLLFYLEKTNLERVSRLGHKHIVKIIKAYKHGGIFNIIFPCAKTNLDHYLRDPMFNSSELCAGPLEASPLWNQMLGIATALNGIMEYSVSAKEPSGSSECYWMIGFHFDLKPANILVEEDGNWVISDFGQATFIGPAGGASRVINQGGTDAYAPPEIDHLNETYSKRYDIWSLGCILLEVTAFIVRGCSGLYGSADEEFRGLDDVRRTKSLGSRGEDQRFFVKSEISGDYELKPEIKAFMEDLCKAERARHKRSKDFLQQVLALNLKMLEPKAENRIDIVDVVRQLSGIIQQRNLETAAGNPLSITPYDGERALGEPDIIGINVWQFGAQWEKASIRIFEGAEQVLRINSVVNNHSSDQWMARWEWELIPEYAFRDDRNRAASDRHICFARAGGTKFQVNHGALFAFQDINLDASVFQSILIGQDVHESLPLVGVKFEKTTSLTHAFMKKLKSDKSGSDSSDFSGPIRVQLWSEKSEEPSESRHDSAFSKRTSTGLSFSSARRNRDALQNDEALPCRVVVFCERTMTTIIIKQNWRIEKHEKDQIPNSNTDTIRFVPTKASRDSRFSATTFKPIDPSDKRCYPGIPLDKNMLRAQEEENEYDCRSVELQFRSADERETFQRKYLNFTYEWGKERKHIENTSKVGTFGRGQNLILPSPKFRPRPNAQGLAPRAPDLVRSPRNKIWPRSKPASAHTSQRELSKLETSDSASEETVKVASVGVDNEEGGNLKGSNGEALKTAKDEEDFDDDRVILDPDSYYREIDCLEERVVMKSEFYRTRGIYDIFDDNMDPSLWENRYGSSTLWSCIAEATKLHPSIREDETLHKMHVIRSLTKSWVIVCDTIESFEHLRQKKFCTNYYSILAERAEGAAAEIVRIDRSEIERLKVILEKLIMGLLSNKIADPENLWLAIEIVGQVSLKLLREIDPTSLEKVPSGIRANLLLCRTLAVLLDLGLTSYAGSHSSRFDLEYISDDRSTIIIQSGLPGLSFTCSLARLACLDGFIGHERVWMFKQGTMQPESTRSDGADRALSIITRIEEFADIWGPVWTVPAAHGQVWQYNVSKGSICRVELEKSTFVQDAVVCHWFPRSAKLFPQKNPFNGKKGIPMGKTDRLVIGRFNENHNCTRTLDQFEETYGLLMNPLDTEESCWEWDARMLSFSLTQYAGIVVQGQQKKRPERTVKELNWAKWNNQPERANPRILELLFGIEVSNCTGNARRIRLRDLILLKQVRVYLERLFTGWTTTQWGSRFLASLESDDNDEFTRLWIEEISYRTQIGSLIFCVLDRLDKTGTKGDRFNVAFIHEYSELSISLDVSRNQWASLLEDSYRTASYAIISAVCLEYDAPKHSTSVCCSVSAFTVLRTTFAVPEILRRERIWLDRRNCLKTISDDEEPDKLVEINPERVREFFLKMWRTDKNKIPSREVQNLSARAGHLVLVHVKALKESYSGKKQRRLSSQALVPSNSVLLTSRNPLEQEREIVQMVNGLRTSS